MQGKKRLVVAILAVVLLAIPLVSFAASGPGKGGNPPGGDNECKGLTLPANVTLTVSSLDGSCIPTAAAGNLSADGRFRRGSGLAKDMVIGVSEACEDFDGPYGDLQIGNCGPPVNDEAAC